MIGQTFDIGRVVRLFRTDKVGSIRMSLRKLHVRWWHASHHTMRKMLERCGVADRVFIDDDTRDLPDLHRLPRVGQTRSLQR